MLLVMHTQTTLNQGLLHTIDLGSEGKRRMRKIPCMQLYIRFKMERIRMKDLTLLIVIEFPFFYVGLKSMYLISKSKTNSSYQISEYQWFNISKHVLMCFYYLWIRKIKMHWQLEKIFSCLCLCLRCMLKQNSNWDGDPLPSHSHPKKEKNPAKLPALL